MNLGNWLAENIMSEQKQIKTVIAIYPGRFQPMGKHHVKAYKWLQDNNITLKDEFDLDQITHALNLPGFIKNEKDKGFNNFINLIGIESPGLTASLAISKYVKGIFN